MADSPFRRSVRSALRRGSGVHVFDALDQAVAIDGYSPALFPRARWHELVGELEAKGPPYIEIDRDDEPSVRTSTEAMHFIASSRYCGASAPFTSAGFAG